MEDLSNRTPQEVLDDHLNLFEHWGTEQAPERIVEEDLCRNISEDIVTFSNRGTFRGHQGFSGVGMDAHRGTARAPAL